MATCASCGETLPAAARFCPSCGFGAGVESGRSTPEERRVVTVLFADLVGYTSLAEHLDPENVKLLIEACFRRLVVDIEDFGGRVDKLLGDAIVALFGAPVAHEDDAERAVRGALRMQRTLGRFVEERAPELGGVADIRMRIGINTGEVLVGTIAGTDYTATGDVVNTASRLQSLAPPGGVLIGSATAALCSSAISTEPFGITQLRGRDQVEQSWLVTGAMATGTRPRRSDIPFVGRVNERAMLDAAVQIVRNGHSGVVSIIGEAGMGKSRLADEVVEQLDGAAIIVRTACAPYGELSPWSPVVTGITDLFGFDRDASPDEVRDVVEGKAREVWGLEPGDEDLERYLDVIFHLLGHPSTLDRVDAAGARDAVATGVLRMLSAHAGTEVTVVVVDDLQWADPLLRDLLAVVVRSLGNRPFLLLTTQRPDPDLAWPPPVDRPLVVQVPLGPLDREEAVTLVCNLLADEEHDASTVDALVERGGGNPLFLVELTALATCTDHGSDLPGSLRALIASRIDQLPAPQRAILDNAAVLGHRGAIGSLARFAREVGQDFDLVDLDELASTGLLEVRGRTWEFGSEVVREVAYQTLTKRVRAQRHAGVAAVLATRGGGIDDVAHHAATAAELYVELGAVPGVKSSIIEHAVEALREAAVDALDTGRYPAASRHASRALDLRRANAETERRLLLVRATAETEQRHFAAATADATAVLESALADGDRVHEGEARRRLGTLAQLQGDLTTARRELDATIAIFEDLEDERRLANALRSRGFAEVFGGSMPEARRYLDDAMKRFATLDDERGLAWTFQNLAWVAFQAGDFEEASIQLDEARERFEELGDHTGVGWASGLQAWVWYFQRQFDRAEALASEVESEARKWGDAWPMLMMQTLLANLRLWTGRLAEAEQIAERALAGFREVDDRYGVMQALGPLNRARAALGKQADAKRGLEESVALGDSFGELAMALQAAAGVTMHLGQGEATVHLAEQVMERNLASGSDTREASVLLALGRLQAGDADGAMAAVDGLDVEDFPFGRAARALVRVVADDLDGGRDDSERVEGERGASYFDLAVARLAAVLADQRSGHDATASLGRLASLASTVGDVGFLAVVQRLEGGSDDADHADLAPGWRRIVDTAVVG